MAVKVKVPKLNENSDEASLTAWYKQEGDPVEKGEPLAEMTTDKAAFEIPAPSGGIVLRILAETKSVLPTGFVLALIGKSGDCVSGIEDANARLLARANARRPTKPAPPANPVRTVGETGSPVAGSGPVRATPAARRLAREHGLDLSDLRRALQVEVITEEMVRRRLT